MIKICVKMEGLFFFIRKQEQKNKKRQKTNQNFQNIQNCMKYIKTLTIRSRYDRIIFVAENGTENHRTTSDKEEGVKRTVPDREVVQ